MRFADAVEFALTSLRKRRLRTFLTASGVMIGIGALVSMISFGKGMQKNVTAAFQASDLFNTVMVMPGGPDEPSGDPDGRRRRREAGRPEGRRARRRRRGRDLQDPGCPDGLSGHQLPGPHQPRRGGGVPARPGRARGRRRLESGEGPMGQALCVERRGGRHRQPDPCPAVGDGGPRGGRRQDAADHLDLDRPGPDPFVSDCRAFSAARGCPCPARPMTFPSRRHRRHAVRRRALADAERRPHRAGPGRADQAAADHERLGPVPDEGRAAGLFGRERQDRVARRPRGRQDRGSARWASRRSPWPTSSTRSPRPSISWT